MKTDPRFATIAGRTSNTRDYFAIRAGGLKGKTSTEWLGIFDRLDVPASPYNTIAGLLDDPHLRAVGMVQEEEHPSEGATYAIGQPNRFSGGNAAPGRPAPRLGQDGAALLSAAGMTEAEITVLKRDGVLLESPQ